MSSQLPPLQGVREPAPGQVLGLAAQDLGAPHPFDGPFSLMKSLKAEIAELRSALREEQQKNGAQVEGLKQDVLDLRRALQQEQAERTSSCDSLGASLASENSSRRSQMQEFKVMMSTELGQRAMVVDLKALEDFAQAMDVELKNEEKQWRETTKDLERQIDSNTAGDNVFTQQVVKTLRDHKKALDDNAASDAEFANNIMPRVQMAGQLLLSAGAWDSPKTKAKCPTQENVSAMLRQNTLPNRPGTS